MHPFTILFLTALAAGLIVQGWLLRRHALHVLAHREQVPEAFCDRVSAEEHQKAADYTAAKVRLAGLELPFGALVLLGWTLGGGIAWLQGQVTALGLVGMWAGVGLILGVMLISGLIELPFSLWRTFRLEARFGFNRITPLLFVRDLGVQLLLSLALGVPLIWVVLRLMEGAGEWWWLWTWVVWIGFSLTLTWAYPTLIAPLFNRFTPLEEGALRERIEGLLTRCGFESRGVFVVDGSRRSSHGNAYFTGLGRAKRIVFFDTLLQSLDVDETEAVLAHELGHFRLHHIRKQLALHATVSLAGLALLGWLAGQGWFYQALGVTGQGHAEALLLFLLVLPVFTQFLTPLVARLSRRFEFEADAFAAGHTQGAALARALVKLYRENAATLTPDPLYSAFHDSHPPALVRIARLSATMATTD